MEVLAFGQTLFPEIALVKALVRKRGVLDLAISWSAY